MKDIYRGAKPRRASAASKASASATVATVWARAMLPSTDGKVSIRTGCTEMGQGIVPPSPSRYRRKNQPETATFAPTGQRDLDYVTNHQQPARRNSNAVIGAATHPKPIGRRDQLGDLISGILAKWVWLRTAHGSDDTSPKASDLASPQVVILNDDGTIQRKSSPPGVSKGDQSKLLQGRMSSIHVRTGAPDQEPSSTGGHLCV